MPATTRAQATRGRTGRIDNVGRANGKDSDASRPQAETRKSYAETNTTQKAQRMQSGKGPLQQVRGVLRKKPNSVITGQGIATRAKRSAAGKAGTGNVRDAAGRKTSPAERDQTLSRLLPMTDKMNRMRDEQASVRIPKRQHEIYSGIRVDLRTPPKATRWVDGKDLPSRGLHNSKNRCCRISVLQALFHVPAFVHFLAKAHPICQRSFVDCPMCALQLFALCYWSPECEAAEMNGLQENLYRVLGRANGLVDAPVYRDYMSAGQMDALNFLEMVLNILPADDNKAYDNTFGIRGTMETVCSACQHVASRTIDAATIGSTGLHIDVNLVNPERGKTLLQYLRRNVFHRLQVDYRCGSCKQTSNTEATAILDRPPLVLVIRLERTSYISSNVTEKILDHVHVDEHINLTEFTRANCSEDNAAGLYMYRLDAVISHRGECIDGGHYTVRVRCRDGINFRTINDNDVGDPSDVIETKEPVKGKNQRGFQPYLLFYNRMT